MLLLGKANSGIFIITRRMRRKSYLRIQEKQWNSLNNKEMNGVSFHRFMELEGHANHMEIAEELGISLGEVRMLKKKVNRT